MAVAVEGDDKEHHHRQGEGHRDVAREVGAAGEEGHQAQQVGEEDEEECREQEGHEPLVFVLADGALGHIVTYEEDDGLQQGLQAFGGLACTAAVAFGHGKEGEDHQGEDHQRGKHVLGDGQVPNVRGGGLVHGTCGIYGHNGPLVQHVAVICGMAMLKAAATEYL